MAGHKLNIRGLKIAQFDKAYTLNEVQPEEITSGDVVVLYDNNMDPLTYNGTPILVVTSVEEETVSGDTHNALTIVPFTPVKVATKGPKPPLSHPFEREEENLTVKVGLTTSHYEWSITSMEPVITDIEAGEPATLYIQKWDKSEEPENPEPNPDIVDETVEAGEGEPQPTAPTTSVNKELDLRVEVLRWEREGTDDSPEISTYDQVKGAVLRIRGPKELTDIVPALVELQQLTLRLR